MTLPSLQNYGPAGTLWAPFGATCSVQGALLKIAVICIESQFL